MRAYRIVITTYLQQDMLSRIHQGDQGIVKCRSRAHTSVMVAWDIQTHHWDDSELHNLLSKFPNSKWTHDTIYATSKTMGEDRNWFVWTKRQAISFVSRLLFEIHRSCQTYHQNCCSNHKASVARHGIPDVIISDNNPQCSSQEFQQFA